MLMQLATHVDSVCFNLQLFFPNLHDDPFYLENNQVWFVDSQTYLVLLYTADYCDIALVGKEKVLCLKWFNRLISYDVTWPKLNNEALFQKR